MAKKHKRQRVKTGRIGQYTGNFKGELRQNGRYNFERLRQITDRRRRRPIEQLTRDMLTIANPDNRLSLAAEDLRNKQPFKTNSQHRIFHNIDGTPADTRYKEVPVKKKDLIILVGEVFIVLIILIGLWCVAEDMSDGVCSLPREFLDMVKAVVRDLFVVQDGLNNLT